MGAMTDDGLDFVLELSFFHFGRRAFVVGAVFIGLRVRGEERGVEDVMNGPGSRQF
jgi:hypothetical protein